jgi:hypothetical protein
VQAHCHGRASMKIRAAPRTLLLAACIFSPPYFCTVLTLRHEPGDWRVLENPRFILRQLGPIAPMPYTATTKTAFVNITRSNSRRPACRNQASRLGQEDGANLLVTGRRRPQLRRANDRAERRERRKKAQQKCWFPLRELCREFSALEPGRLLNAIRKRCIGRHFGTRATSLTQ